MVGVRDRVSVRVIRWTFRHAVNTLNFCPKIPTFSFTLISFSFANVYTTAV